MTDNQKLQEYIEETGIKKEHIALMMGISPNALRMKLNGQSDFKVREADRLSHLLGLTREERDECFFAPEMYWTTALSRKIPDPQTGRERRNA